MPSDQPAHLITAFGVEVDFVGILEQVRARRHTADADLEEEHAGRPNIVLRPRRAALCHLGRLVVHRLANQVRARDVDDVGAADPNVAVVGHACAAEVVDERPAPAVGDGVGGDAVVDDAEVREGPEPAEDANEGDQTQLPVGGAGSRLRPEVALHEVLLEVAVPEAAQHEGPVADLDAVEERGRPAQVAAEQRLGLLRIHEAAAYVQLTLHGRVRGLLAHDLDSEVRVAEQLRSETLAAGGTP
mmetsp:Transcript_46194/g.134486  ORF Transcript_46194/g.134486 Transcript_46194/m.134486 type:complete len:244 (+) Transcript_46194:301-1032(+)